MSRETDWGSDAVPLSSGGAESPPSADAADSRAARPRFTLKRVTARIAGGYGRTRGVNARLVVLGGGVAIVGFAAVAIGSFEGGSKEAPIRIADPAPKVRTAERPRQDRRPARPEKRRRRATAGGMLEERRQPVSSAAAAELAPLPEPPEPAPEAPAEEPAPEPAPAPEPSAPAPPRQPPATPAAAVFGLGR